MKIIMEMISGQGLRTAMRDGWSEKAHLLEVRGAVQEGRYLPEEGIRPAAVQDPVPYLCLIQQQGHPVMDGLHGAVRICGQDDEMLAIAVVPAASRHEQCFPALFLKSIFCLGFVPLIEGRCRDCNAPVPDALTEERLFGGYLMQDRAGIVREL